MLSDGLFTAARRRLRARKNAASCGNGFNSQPPEGGWLEMIAHKIARILNGDPNYADNWHDIAGYATLIDLQLQGDDK